jgi:hypothetical protein
MYFFFFLMLSISDDWVLSDGRMICERELERFQNEGVVF